MQYLSLSRPAGFHGPPRFGGIPIYAPRATGRRRSESNPRENICTHGITIAGSDRTAGYRDRSSVVGPAPSASTLRRSVRARAEIRPFLPRVSAPLAVKALPGILGAGGELAEDLPAGDSRNLRDRSRERVVGTTSALFRQLKNLTPKC